MAKLLATNKSLDRAAEYWGRAVLAMNGVLAGAESASRSAGQFNR